jgi:hypothetical protein
MASGFDAARRKSWTETSRPGFSGRYRPTYIPHERLSHDHDADVGLEIRGPERAARHDRCVHRAEELQIDAQRSDSSVDRGIR